MLTHVRLSGPLKHRRVVHLHAIYCRASYLFALGKFKMAKALLTRTMKIKEELFGLQHPCRPASMDMLAAIFKRDGDGTATKQLLERSLAINLATYGPEHPLVAASYYRLAAMDHDLPRNHTQQVRTPTCLKPKSIFRSSKPPWRRPSPPSWKPTDCVHSWPINPNPCLSWKCPRARLLASLVSTVSSF
jgi:hypothetical protein